jgi:hypothetical protein
MCSHPNGATWADHREPSLPARATADGAIEIDRVSMNNGGGDEARAPRAEALVFECAISKFSLTMKEHCPPQRVACLALVETGMAVLAQRRVG